MRVIFYSTVALSWGGRWCEGDIHCNITVAFSWGEQGVCEDGIQPNGSVEFGGPAYA